MKIIIVIFALLIFLTGCEKTRSDKKESTEKKENEKTEVVLSKESLENLEPETILTEIKNINSTFRIPAVLIADQNNEAQVVTIIPGRICNVYASVGTYVHAGQTLMKIEGLEIGVLKAEFLKAKSNVSYTEQEFNRQKTLKEQNIGAQKNYFAAKTEYEKAAAELNAIDKKIHSIGLKDEDILNENDDLHSAGVLQVKSPISGVVVERNVVMGQYVESSTVAFKILNTQSLYVDGQVYENDLMKLKDITNSEFRTQSYPNESFICKIIYKGQMIDEKTRTIKVRATINNRNEKLKPQMFGEMILNLTGVNKCILIPSSALFTDNDKSFVFVRENDSIFVKKEVKTIPAPDESLEVVSGLKEGEKVVIKGVFELKSELLKDLFGEEE